MNHGQRLEDLLSRIEYKNEGFHLKWHGSKFGSDAFTPYVEFLAQDATNPNSNSPLKMTWKTWEDDLLLASCLGGSSDEYVTSLAIAQAHYSISALLIHEIGEFFTYHGSRIYPPHRKDPMIPYDDDSGPDGNGVVVLWLEYDSVNTTRKGCNSNMSNLMRMEDIRVPPNRKLKFDESGIRIGISDGSAELTFPWTSSENSPEHCSDITQALECIHNALVSTELEIIAQNLLLEGTPLMKSALYPDGIEWSFSLTYDG